MEHANKRITVCLGIVAIILPIIPCEGSSADSGPKTTMTGSRYGSSDSTSSTWRYLDASFSESAASKQQAALMLGLMNHSVDPCQDFYQYSCGNGVDNPYLRPVDPKDAAMNRIKGAVLSSTAENPARLLYESCLDETTPTQEEGIAYIRDLVWDLGEFDPRVEDIRTNKSHYAYIDERPMNLTALLAKMMKHDFTPLFDLTLDVDKRNTSQFILRLTPPIFNSPLTENIRKYTCLKDYNKKMTERSTNDLDKLYEDYKYCMNEKRGLGINAYHEDVMASVKKMYLLKNVTENFLTRVEQGIHFGVAGYAEDIFKVIPNTDAIRLSLIEKEFTLYTLQEMDDGVEKNGNSALEILDFSWHGLVEDLLECEVDPTRTYVQVYFPQELFQIFDLQNDILYDHGGIRRFSNILLALWSQYLHNILIEPLGHSPHTEEYCLHVVTELLPDITTQLYVSSFEQDMLRDKMAKVNEITKSVKEAFINQFTDRSSDFIEKIRQKLELIKIDIGEELTKDYQHFIDTLPKTQFSITTTASPPHSNTPSAQHVTSEEFQEELNFPRNAVQLLNRRRRISYSFYDKNPNDNFNMWLQSNLPYYTAGSTSYPFNTVLIPIGSVESPFYEQKGPDLINFAGLGNMISHKILQAFDLSGDNFKIHPNLSASKQCQKEQLSNIQTMNINDGSVNVTLPADLVLNEVLYDSSAVQLAWKAYVTSREDIEVLPWLDPDPIKQFYLRSAQIHCEKTRRVNLPHLKENEHLHSSLRVNHMARTDPFFQQAFRCPKNAPMKHIPQCSYMLFNLIDDILLASG